MKNHEKAKEQTNGNYQEWFDTITKGTSDSSTTSSSSSIDDSITRDQKAALKKLSFIQNTYIYQNKTYIIN